MWLCECSCENHTRNIVSGYALRAGKVNFCDCDNSRKGGNLKEDLRGKKVGKLIVISQNKDYTWDCVCECGNHINVKTAKITHNKINMCDKCREKQKEEQENKYIGMKFNNWTIIGKIDSRTFICKCSCGNVKKVALRNLKSGMSKSCGKCSRSKPVEDLVGKKFNHLTVIKYAGHGRWECKCDCDGPLKDKIIVTTTALKNGYVKSCGHLAYEPKESYTAIDVTNVRSGMLVAIEPTNKRNNRGQVYWKCRCDCGNISYVVATNIKLGLVKACSNHTTAHGGSQAENDIKAYIENKGYSVVKDRDVLDGKEIDIYVPELKLGIEYNGSVFHDNMNNLYEDKPKLYHQQKFLLAKEKGIHLINIFDVDWQNNQEKIKMYLKSLLVRQNKIYARDCIVKIVPNDDAINFMEQYHLQGANKGAMKINYGLYYKVTLMSVMSFGNPRFLKHKEGEYELHRYCVKDGYTVIGGAERLLKSFEREYKPKYIVSYSDNDYFLGIIYERLGFSFVHQSTPRYYWYLDGAEIKKENCRLKQLEKYCKELYAKAVACQASNKEDYVMTSLGACKVYRSGNTKWEKWY